MEAHARLYALAPWATLLLMPVSFAVAAGLTGLFARKAAGSGISQVIAVAETRCHGRRGGQRVTLRIAAGKVGLPTVLGKKIRGIGHDRTVRPTLAICPRSRREPSGAADVA